MVGKSSFILALIQLTINPRRRQLLTKAADHPQACVYTLLKAAILGHQKMMGHRIQPSGQHLIHTGRENNVGLYK